MKQDKVHKAHEDVLEIEYNVNMCYTKINHVVVNTILWYAITAVTYNSGLSSY